MKAVSIVCIVIAVFFALNVFTSYLSAGGFNDAFSGELIGTTVTVAVVTIVRVLRSKNSESEEKTEENDEN